MEIKLDVSSLPADGQAVKFQIVIEELDGVWRSGVYKGVDQLFWVNDDEWYDVWTDVVRWEPVS